MVSVAQKNLPFIKFYQCDPEKIDELPGTPFDLITSVMVLQFIDNIKQFFIHLNKALTPAGVLAFAVFNPEYVAKNHGVAKNFEGFETPQQPKSGFLCLTEESRIPVFIRTLEEYDSLIIPLGYQRIYSDKPAFTAEYLSQFDADCDTSSPEFLIMVYQKRTQSEVDK